MSDASKPEPDWKAIAMELAKCLYTAYKQPYGNMGNTSFLDLNGRCGHTRAIHWRERWADALEQIPGVEVDREACALLDQPAPARKKSLAALDNKRKQKEFNGNSQCT